MEQQNYIDIYCERTSGAFWAEPFNAITNLAFIVAAVWAWRFWKAKGTGEKEILFLALNLAVVGIGSFLFHTFAQHWSMLADVIPIAIFIHVAIFSAAHRMFNLTKWRAALVVLGFFAFNMACEKYIPADWLNGSMTYFPAFLALLAISTLAHKKHLQAAKFFGIATFVFIISITLRSLDMQFCEQTPLQIGTHFMWHILNGLLMFNVIKALLQGDLQRNK